MAVKQVRKHIDAQLKVSPQMTSVMTPFVGLHFDSGNGTHILECGYTFKLYTADGDAWDPLNMPGQNIESRVLHFVKDACRSAFLGFAAGCKIHVWNPISELRLQLEEFIEICHMIDKEHPLHHRYSHVWRVSMVETSNLFQASKNELFKLENEILYPEVTVDDKNEP